MKTLTFEFLRKSQVVSTKIESGQVMSFSLNEGAIVDVIYEGLEESAEVKGFQSTPDGVKVLLDVFTDNGSVSHVAAWTDLILK